MSAPLKRSLATAAACWRDISEQTSFDRSLEAHCRGASADEKAAVRSILYCALRRAVFLERLVKALTSRTPSPEVASLLAVSLSQIIEMPEKPYAVVNEAIEAARSKPETARAAGLVNACLRRYQRERTKLDARILSDRVARFNAPSWWIERMELEFGRENLDALFDTVHRRPPLTLRVNVRKTTVRDWLALAAADGCPARALGGEAVLLEKPRPVHRIPGFAEGLVSVQDAGAQLAGRFLAPKAGERILDACAAPGGKTAHILELADCTVTALESDPTRAPRIGENLSRLSLTADVTVCDAADTAHWWDGTPVDVFKGPSRRTRCQTSDVFGLAPAPATVRQSRHTRADRRSARRLFLLPSAQELIFSYACIPPHILRSRSLRRLCGAAAACGLCRRRRDAAHAVHARAARPRSLPVHELGVRSARNARRQSQAGHPALLCLRSQSAEQALVLV